MFRVAFVPMFGILEINRQLLTFLDSEYSN